jgi:hypothetical protein
MCTEIATGSTGRRSRYGTYSDRSSDARSALFLGDCQVLRRSLGRSPRYLHPPNSAYVTIRISVSRHSTQTSRGTWGLRLVPELKILVPTEVHDHESTTSSQCTAPVLSQNGCAGTNDSSRADIKVCQSFELGGARVRGYAIELRNLSILWPVIYDDSTTDILRGMLKPVHAESCTAFTHIK